MAELLRAGAGAQPDARIAHAGACLTPSERRRVRQLVGKGAAAWDEPSARYAVAVARARLRIPLLFGPRTMRIFYGAVCLVFVADGIGAVRHEGHRIHGAYQLTVGAMFAILMATNANDPRPIRASLRRNRASFPNASRTDDVATRVPDPPSRRRQAAGMVAVVLVFGALSAVILWVSDGLPHERLSHAALVGFATGVGSLIGVRLVNEPARRRASDHRSRAQVS